MTGSAEDAGGDWNKEVYIKLIGRHAESGKVKLTDLLADRYGGKLQEEKI